MENDYKNMSNSELLAEKKTLEDTFTQYHEILLEVYESMYKISEKHDEIELILKQRNGK